MVGWVGHWAGGGHCHILRKEHVKREGRAFSLLVRTLPRPPPLLVVGRQVQELFFAVSLDNVLSFFLLVFHRLSNFRII